MRCIEQLKEMVMIDHHYRSFGFGMLTLFKIIPAQNKPTCGSCASLSKYVKKYYTFLILN